MKTKVNLRLACISLALFIALGASTVMASGPTIGLNAPAPSGPNYTNFQVQNQGTADANVAVEYYDTDGNLIAAATDGFTVPQGSSVVKYAAANPGLPNGFRGSAVVLSSEPVKAIVNHTDLYSLGSSGFASAWETGDTPLLFPSVYRKAGSGLLSTRFILQNTGTSDAIVSINYSNGVSQPDTIPPNASHFFDLSDDAIYGSLGIPTGFIGSATVTSSEPLAGTAEIFFQAGNRLQMYDGFTSGEGDTTVYVARVLKKVGAGVFYTNFQVQNVDPANLPNTVHMRYVGTPAFSPDTVDYTLTTSEPSKVFYSVTVPNMPDGFVGGCIITADDPIVVVAQQYATAPGQYAIVAYNGVPASGVSDTWYLPRGMRAFGSGGNWYTNVQVQNVEASSVQVKTTYSGGSLATPFEVTDTIPPNGSKVYYTNSYSTSEIPAGWIGAVKVEATTPGNDLVVVLFQGQVGGSGDTESATNGFTP